MWVAILWAIVVLFFMQPQGPQVPVLCLSKIRWGLLLGSPRMSGTSQEMAVALDIRNLREPGCGGTHPILGRQSEGHRKFQTSLRYRVSSGSTWVSD